MVTYLLKLVAAALEMLGRILVFNWSPPAVGGIIKDVHYGREDKRKQTLDIFIPQGPPPYPVLVYTHGSGFLFMDKKSFRRVCGCFAHHGYLVFNVNHGLAPKYTFTDQFAHVGRAIMYAYKQAKAYGGDNTRMFLAGDSAGAYYASIFGAATRKRELLAPLGIEETIPAESLRGVLLFYGVFDLDTFPETGFPFIRRMSREMFGRDPEVYRERAEVASPARQVGSDYPPAFISSGEMDWLHSESVMFDRVLSDAGVPHDTQFFNRRKYPESIHGYLSVPFFRTGRLAMRAALEFLSKWSA